jgi:hypothetical protein
MSVCAVCAAAGVPVMVTRRFCVPGTNSPLLTTDKIHRRIHKCLKLVIQGRKIGKNALTHLDETVTSAPDKLTMSRRVEPCLPTMLPTSLSGMARLIVVEDDMSSAPLKGDEKEVVATALDAEGAAAFLEDKSLEDDTAGALLMVTTVRSVRSQIKKNKIDIPV